jgi:type VI secretion system secreted protein Hcp
MALEQYIDLAGITGEAQAPDVTGSVAILSWSFSLKRAVGAGRADFGAVAFSKRVDSTSPLILARCAQGAALPQAKLMVRSTGHRSPRVVVDLRDVHITEVASGFDEVVGDVVETVELTYGKMWFGGAVVDRRGTGEPLTWFAWDVALDAPAT